MIPKCKDWRVTYWRIEAKPIVCGIRRRKIASCVVTTINKRFARWLATEKIGYPTQLTPSEICVTVSRVRGGNKHV